MPTTPGTAQFPTALPDADSLFRVVNFDTSTSLNTSILAGTLSIILDDASLYPASGAIKIEDEIIFYTSKSSNTLTIPGSGGRGADGSVAASHSAGATVRAVAIARHHMVLAEEIAALAAKVGIGADTPVSGDFFKGTGTGSSGWSALTSGDVTGALGFTPQPLDADLTALAALGSTGFATRTASNTWAQRTFADAAGITWTNGDGVSGNPSAVWNPSTVINSISLWDGSQASRTLTANLSGSTDPVITFSDGVVNISTGTLQQGGTAVVLQSRTITSGTGLTGGGALSGDLTLNVGAGSGITSNADDVAVNQAFAFTWTAVHTFTPAARSSGSAAYLTINAPADTALTASTEAIGISVVGATRQHATGALTTQREYVFAKPTYSFVGASTITNAATLAITGAPVTGTNATLTNSWSFWVQADQSRFDGVVSQLTGGSVDPLTGPNLVGTQTVKFGTAASVADSASGDYRQFQSYIINSGTRNIVAGTFGARADAAGQAWGINPYAFANFSGSTAVAIENNFGVLTSGGAAYGELFVVVGNFASTAFIQMQSGASGISAANGIVVSKGGAGLDPISGAFLSFAGGAAMTSGCDFSGATFSTAPILLGNNAFIKSKDSGGTARIILGIDSNNGTVLQSAGGAAPGSGVGFRLVNLANTINLISILDAGGMTVDTSLTTPLLTASTSMTSPIHYGGTSAGSTATIKGTSNGSPSSAHVLLNTNTSGTSPGGVLIGTPTSSYLSGATVQIQGTDNSSTFFVFDQYSTAGNLAGNLTYRHARGTTASPTQTKANDPLAVIDVRAYESGGPFTTTAIARTITFAAEDITSAAHGSYMYFATTAIGSTTLTERMRITDVGNVKIGGSAVRGTTEGTNELVIFNGTAPAGTLTNGASFYAASGEMRVMDSGGTSTLLSPHDDDGLWVFDSTDTQTGKRLLIDVERLLRFVNDHFGTDFIHEYEMAA